MAGIEVEQGKGQTDLVVVIALALEHPVPLCEHRRHKLFGRRLADAAGDANHARRKTGTPPGSEALQRREGIVHNQTDRRTGAVPAPVGLLFRVWETLRLNPRGFMRTLGRPQIGDKNATGLRVAAQPLRSRPESG